MKKILSVLVFSFCFIAVAPLVKAQSYDGPVYKEQIPVHRESRGIDVRHNSVKWGGKKLAWVSALSLKLRDNYYKENPRVRISTKTTHLINNNKVNKKH